LIAAVENLLDEAAGRIPCGGACLHRNFYFHVRSSLVAIISLPFWYFDAFIVMQLAR